VRKTRIARLQTERKHVKFSPGVRVQDKSDIPKRLYIVRIDRSHQA